MSYFFTYAVNTFLLPPLCFLVTATLGFAVERRRPRLGRSLIFGSLALLWVVSTPAFNIPLLEKLGWPAPANLQDINGAQAIVVLSAGIYPRALEYGGTDTVNHDTLERLRYAAHMYRRTGLPILVSGGRGPGKSAAEAELMKSVLENDFATPVRWVEVESRNTLENARESARILHKAGVGRAFLVTQSIDMRRAVQSFAPTGIIVIAAPVGFVTAYQKALGPADFLPSGTGFRTSNRVAHEFVGMLWYAIRLRFE